jgi:hypothetical protein
MFRKKIALGLPVLLIVLMVSCKKYVDKPGATDPRLDRPYCNDPEAVNFNWDFPGKPDNSICVYPADVFVGNYDYYDSVYDANNVLVKEQTFALAITASSHFKIQVAGFCPTGAITFTAGRRLRADADSTVPGGQILCRDVDTLAGSFYKEQINAEVPILFNLTVTSDTGLNVHRGRAIRR